MSITLYMSTDLTSSDAVFEPPNGQNDAVSIEPPPAPSPNKKRRQMTEEQRERMKAQLAKGRETALANRRKKALLKRKAKEDQQLYLKEAVSNTTIPPPSQSSEQEIENLKRQIEELKTQKASRPPTPTPKPQEEQKPDVEAIHHISTYTPAPW